MLGLAAVGRYEQEERRRLEKINAELREVCAVETELSITLLGLSLPLFGVSVP